MFLSGAGDAVALVAKPIARIVDGVTKHAPVRFRTHLTHCVRCGRTQKFLNQKIPFPR